MYSFFEGQFLESNEVKVHASDLALQRGYGIFDFFRLQSGKPVFIDDYLNRFFKSAEWLRLAVPYSKDEIRNICLELIQKNGLEQAGVKLLLTGGYTDDGYSIGKRLI